MKCISMAGGGDLFGTSVRGSVSKLQQLLDSHHALNSLKPQNIMESLFATENLRILCSTLRSVFSFLWLFRIVNQFFKNSSWSLWIWKTAIQSEKIFSAASDERETFVFYSQLPDVSLTNWTLPGRTKQPEIFRNNRRSSTWREFAKGS